MPDVRLCIAIKSPPVLFMAKSSIPKTISTSSKTAASTNGKKYYSVAEAMEKYGIRRDDVYNYARYNSIRKMHHGKSMFLLKENFDKVMAEKSGS